jgi:uncharacterized protein (TIGR02145 family)
MNNLSKFNLFIAFISLSSLIAISCEKSDDESLNGRTSSIFNPTKTYGTMTDQDGNIYKTITIGTQTWMAENLRTTKYNDGSAIPNVSDSIAWSSLLSGAYCNYKNTTDIDFIATNGRLYNWYALNSGKLAPQGWHVPSRDEFETLITNLGRDTITGGKLKESGITHWINPNTGATNESGFTALPSGYRGSLGYIFQGDGHLTGYWTAFSDGDYSYGEYSYAETLIYDEKKIATYIFGKYFGLSVRLIKD